MTFSISFLNVPLEYLEEDQTIASAIGMLKIGDFEEEFVSSLFEWTREDYVSQWTGAIKAILAGDPKAALIVEYISPRRSNKLIWWPMYRMGNSVKLQNHLLFFDQLTKPFSLDRAFSFIPDFPAANEDAVSISTWTTTLAEIQAFANHSTCFGLAEAGESA